MIDPKARGFGWIQKSVLAGLLAVGFAAATIASAFAQQFGTFANTGSLNTARVSHAATLLSSGQVLVEGGSNGSGALGSAELYDPAAGKWTVTGSMKTVRYAQTATLLQNGEVLVAGGLISISVTGVVSCSAGAELYNPSNRQWTTTGSMKTARYQHAASLLDNGQVLVAGGFGCSSGGSVELNSAELYDPSTGAWSATGSMNFARASTQATLLQNGDILMPGGNAGSSGDNTAEVYSNGTWTLTSSTRFVHNSAHAAPLTNGDVLIFGGHLSSYASEFFNPAANIWTSTGNIGVNPPNGPLTLLQTGQVLLAGGESGYGTDNLARLYNSSSNAWLATGSMNHARTGHTATLLQSGQVLVAGGEVKNSNNLFSVLSSAELYTP